MQANDRPNILWLCTDQQRFDTLGCYGNKFVNTPNIDKLAKNGVRFSRAYCQNPLCSPSRASFLTGRYPGTCRTRQNGQDIPEEEILVTRLLHDNGYIGGLAGKLHLSSCNYSVCKTRERRINDGYEYFAWSHGHGPLHDWPFHDYAIWLKSKGVEYSHPAREDCKYVKVGMSEELHQTKWCTDRAIEFIESVKNEGAPWFFSLNWFDPHHAFDPPKEYLERYLPILDTIPLPDYIPGELENKSPLQRLDHNGAYGRAGSFAYDNMTEYDHKLIRAAYYAMIDLIDVQVGRLIEYLESTDQLTNTLIIFHSDHGESLGDHGLYLKGGYFYEASVHVPLIISMKDHTLSNVCSDGLVELVDIAPTILDACGIPKHPGMQGKSLFGMLMGMEPLDKFKKTVYSEYHTTTLQNGVDAFCSMLHDGRYKLTKIHALSEKYPNDCKGELYDLQTDPGEHINLYNDSKCTDIKLDMLEQLCDTEALMADPLPVPRAPW
ncbi:MAG: sulfatase-like hydrolase/transferase [Clostridia bacterium]|nr:sulfatase-like hydrolase/transferase [Clostridia bacterium]